MAAVSGNWIDAFCRQQRLPESYGRDAASYYLPLLEQLVCRIADNPTVPLVVGINGAQGTGKSTLADFLVRGVAETAGLNAISLSLDDLYLGKQERQRLARQIHPLLATRGVPGTHDLQLADNLFSKLFSDAATALAVPRFDKSCDDRAAVDSWPVVQQPLHLLVLEGWCVGCLAQPEAELSIAVNDLERQDDPDGRWRRFVNSALVDYQQRLWSRLDMLVMLQAPDFEQVYSWRTRQEQKLVERTGRVTELCQQDAMRRFISHYERLTRWMLQDMPQRADWVFQLDRAQRITRSYRHDRP